jgi:rhodanese-related sulfurtransferase
MMECLVIAGIGTALGLGTNAMRGKSRIDLTRNYFPVLVGPAPATQQSGEDSASGPAPDPSVPREKSYEELARDLELQGFQAVRHEEVEALFKDDLYRAGGYVFIDARNDEHYSEGHIPGAYHFNRFWSSGEIDNVMQGLAPVLTAAVRVVVYCGGGDCTDSMFAARELINRGTAPEKVSVYAEGITRWRSAGLAIESGQRNSGVLTGGGP